MSSILSVSCNVNVSSSQPLAITSLRPSVGRAPISWSSVIGICSPPILSSQELPTAKLLTSRRGNGVSSSLVETEIVGIRGNIWLSAFAQERPGFGCGAVKISATEAASRGCVSCSKKGRAGGRVLVRSSHNSGVCGSSSLRRTCGENFHNHCRNERSLGTLESRRSGDDRWGLAAFSHRGGYCVEGRNSSRACRGEAVKCSSRSVCGSSPGRRKKWSGKSEGMELFKPQLRDTVPFQFLYDYHTTPLRAVKDSISPICFFGLGQVKPVVQVVQAGDPVLHEPAEEVRLEEIGSARIEKIINDMVATMRNAPGVGLAAPQIGVQLQIIVLEDTTELMSYCSPEECEAQQRSPFDLLVIINPKLKAKSGSGSAMFFEGCLSVEGYRALVERDLEVEVTGLGRDGRPIHVEASGWKARILQHECDHLAGNLYVDKMVPRSFRTKDNLRLPLPAGCPKPGVCRHSSI